VTSWAQGLVFGYVLGVFSGPVAVAAIAFYFSWRDRRRAR
jgi:hypothetical protein